MRMDRERNLMMCEYCQSEAVPPLDEEGVQVLGETEKVCPGCGSKLSDGLIETQPMLYCAQCHGMLLGMEQMYPLVERLRAIRGGTAGIVLAREESERVIHCPLCSGEMDDHPYGGPGNVMVDSCENCSVVWLDRGELRRMVSAPDPQPIYSGYEFAGGGEDRNRS